MYTDNDPQKVEFEGEAARRYTSSFQPPQSKLVRWVIERSGGRIKDERMANLVLLCLVALIVIATLVFSFSGKSGVSRAPINDAIPAGF